MSNEGKNPLVSVITPFFNTSPEFLREAVESVISQTFHNWELLLVDDGDSGPATKLATAYSEKYAGKIWHFDHDGHANLGQSASRNVGIRKSKGDYVALLDSDDIWLPHKLETQVQILEKNPKAGMVYANTKYWYNWPGNPNGEKVDFIPELGVTTDRIYEPPQLLPLFLSGKASVPCVNSLLIRKDVLIKIGGFEARFRTADEDQAFYAKMCLFAPIYVSGVCHDLYRQHHASVTAIAIQKGTVAKDREQFLQWLESYLAEHDVTDIDVWRALKRESWKVRLPGWFPKQRNLEKVARWGKKWVLRGEERIFPLKIRNWLWIPKEKRGALG
jgi:glycosyltransferase involved in cell wall biosynthesis